MIRKYLFIFFVISIIFSIRIKSEEKHIVVVTTSYNNKKWYKKNLDSFINQKYNNCNMIYIDDCSEDCTGDLVEKYIKEKDTQNKILLIKNKVRRGVLENQYSAIHSCNKKSIIVILDGDDWLADNCVLQYINNIYANPDIWITYGQFRGYPDGKIHNYSQKVSADVVEKNSFRDIKFSPSHLRTFYAGLFQKIKIEDLMYKEAFFKMSCDLAAMLPMIEMAKNGHFKRIEKVLLIYNRANPINHHKISWGFQKKMAKIVRSRPKYEAIEDPF